MQGKLVLLHMEGGNFSFQIQSCLVCRIIFTKMAIVLEFKFKFWKDEEEYTTIQRYNNKGPNKVCIEKQTAQTYKNIR